MRWIVPRTFSASLKRSRRTRTKQAQRHRGERTPNRAVPSRPGGAKGRRQRRRGKEFLLSAPGPPTTARVSRAFIIPHSSAMRRRKTDVRERKRKSRTEEGRKKRKRRLIELCGDCVNEPVKGSHCLAATSIWYCTFLLLPHCLLSQCLLSPPLYSLALSLLKN